jgi:hypothetical protein
MYRLAGIIDSESAGFYPASYELSVQDTYLGGGNRHISFYLLLKEHMASLVPRHFSQFVLLRANEIIWETQQRYFFEGTNIPAHVRMRFLDMGRLIKDGDPYIGWRRIEGQVIEFDNTTFQELENDAVEQTIAKRTKAQ